MNADSEMSRVTHSFTKVEVYEMPRGMPLSVQKRIVLNSKGFKFIDDGKPSLIINENPIPLGCMKTWKDIETGTIHYEQIIP